MWPNLPHGVGSTLPLRVDLLEAIAKGLGLALAVGMIVGAAVPSIVPAWGPATAAVPLGVIVSVAMLSGADEPIWLGFPVGAAGAMLAAVVSRDVLAGAARRLEAEEPGPSGRGAEQAAGREAAEVERLRAHTRLTDDRAAATASLTGVVVIVAVIVAALSLLVAPISLLVFAALLWLAVARRRRAMRKYEGLRVLR